MTISTPNTPGDLRFACDAMCGGLARWLWAIGYDATWSPDIDDGDLVRQAHRQHRLLLSSDTRLFERRLITSRQVSALLIPHGLRRLEQLHYVSRQLHLPVQPPRCMTCGGPLVPAAREDVAAEVPARSLIWATRFYRCGLCAKVFWQGTHWRHIAKVRETAASLAGPTPP